MRTLPHFCKMSEKYKFNDPLGMYFVTMATVGWVDIFTRTELKHIIIDSLRYCQMEKGLVINAWCLMTSHLHMIIRTDKDPLSGILRDFKKFTANKIIQTIDSSKFLKIPENPRKRILVRPDDHESRRDWMLELFGEVA